MLRKTKESRSLPGWLRPFNRIVIALGRLGVAVGPVRVLTLPGRRTGEPRPAPVTPITVDGRRYVIAALPQADWARNARAAGSGELSRGRRRVPVTVHEVDDPGLRGNVMRSFPVQAPGGVGFYVRLGLVDGADPEQFAAVADRVAVFELRER
jgi:deazaflavin-dependent oxidoreductase (nitroreductase family)